MELNLLLSMLLLISGRTSKITNELSYSQSVFTVFVAILYFTSFIPPVSLSITIVLSASILWLLFGMIAIAKKMSIDQWITITIFQLSSALGLVFIQIYFFYPADWDNPVYRLLAGFILLLLAHLNLQRLADRLIYLTNSYLFYHFIMSFLFRERINPIIIGEKPIVEQILMLSIISIVVYSIEKSWSKRSMCRVDKPKRNR